MQINEVMQGDALSTLKTFQDESVDCVVTSPPYWALRDYGVEGQLGLEPTFQQYIIKLCDIFDEVKRVLKKEGTCWVNIGDTYISKGEGRHDGYNDPKYKNGRVGRKIEANALPQSCPEKCLAQIPSRFAIEMTNRDWILRNEIIWHKPNCMPSSAKDRFTVDFEKIFFFVKNKKYWFDTQFELATTAENRPFGIVREREFGYKTQYPDVRKKNWRQEADKRDSYFEQPVGHQGGGNTGFSKYQPNPKGRIKRTVWKVYTKPFKGAHFAVYPEKLIETPILAGCPEGGVEWV